MEKTTILERGKVESRNHSPAPVRSSNSKKYSLLISSVLVIGTGFGVYFFQDAKIKDSRADASSLKTQKESLILVKKDLEDKNKNLTKSIEVLQSQLAYSSTASPQTDPSSIFTEPKTKLTVSAIKNLAGTEFAKSGFAPPRGDFKVIYVKVTNQSDTEESYEINEFSAVNKSGIVVKPQIFSPSETQGLWNNSRLTSGGTQDIILLFAKDQDVVVLTYSPSSGDSSVSVPLPTTQ